MPTEEGIITSEYSLRHRRQKLAAGDLAGSSGAELGHVVCFEI